MAEPERIDCGWIDPEFVSGHFAHSISTQVRDMEYFGCSGRIYRHSASQPVVARNTLVNEFMLGSDSPWLWMVDADMVFDKGHVQKLWTLAQETGATMVTGLAMIWKEKMAVPSLFYENAEGQLINIFNQIPKRGAEIAACGLASVLVHRSVFEEMQPHRNPDFRWFDFILNREIGINGDEMTGIDVQFFVRARQLGHKLVVEPEARTWHLEDLPIGYDEWKLQWETQS